MPMATLPNKTIEYRFVRGKNRRFDSGKLLFFAIKNADGRSRTGTWGEPHQILSLARLPISSHRHSYKILSKFIITETYSNYK